MWLDKNIICVMQLQQRYNFEQLLFKSDLTNSTAIIFFTVDTYNLNVTAQMWISKKLK